MDINQLKQLLTDLKNDNCTIDEAIKEIKHLPYKDFGNLKIDTHRNIRQGYAEAVYSPGKTATTIISALQEIHDKDIVAIATRLSPKKALLIQKELTNSVYDEEARVLTLGDFKEAETKGYTLIITAGTVDIPVAKEAIITLKANRIRYEAIYDCGIAGIHRLTNHLPLIQEATAIIVIAGMEGALASFIGGLSACPVIAVPTSNGYGASFNGLAALLTMLNSCASCVSVVNIDNGYGAGIIASLITRQYK